MEQENREIRTYVIRAGHMTKAQKTAYDTLAPVYTVPFSESLLDFSELFGNDNPVVLEIGFGMGHATIDLAEANPETNYLGIEVHRPGVGRVLSEIDRLGLKNLKVLPFDAVKALDHMISDGSLSGIHLFFPDPWQKKRHHKRRLVRPDLIRRIVPKLESGGYFYAVTDWADYADQMLEVFSAEPGLKNAYDGFADPRSWRPQTKFERKGIEKKHVIRELYFLRT